ncbi:MAG: ABC transporter ATP-binding protein [Deltaproteobacteria bacterium]|nr:ABC transporter ATP-binding protein [Deltaproteobacteria bacterium]
MNYAIDVKGVRKTFVSGLFRKRRKEALKGIDLQVPVGAFWGLLGPNGAGKTTLLSILSNLIIPEQGQVLVLGKDIRLQGSKIFPKINLTSGHANFLWSLTVRENLEYFGMLYGLARKARTKKIDYLLDFFDLTNFARVKFDELSTGTKQRLALAKALINDPELLLLDEPTVGLDPDVARKIREGIQQLHREKGVTILMTTHNMKEAELLCEQVAFIREGAIQAYGRPDDLKEQLHLGDAVAVDFEGSLDQAALTRLPGVYRLQVNDSCCRILVDDHHIRLPRIFDYFHTAHITIRSISIQEADLEELFFAFAG